jgi:hypothetical protein
LLCSEPAAIGLESYRLILTPNDILPYDVCEHSHDKLVLVGFGFLIIALQEGAIDTNLVSYAPQKVLFWERN